MSVSRLIYFSENQIALHGSGSPLADLREILRASNRNNASKGVTGALVLDDQWFLQILEGARPDVWAIFERIREDERHSNVTIVEIVDVGVRVFGNWWMGLATRTARTEAVFARVCRGGRFDPRGMSAAEMLAMLVDLSRLGLARELASGSVATTPPEPRPLVPVAGIEPATP